MVHIIDFIDFCRLRAHRTQSCINIRPAKQYIRSHRAKSRIRAELIIIMQLSVGIPFTRLYGGRMAAVRFVASPSHPSSRNGHLNVGEKLDSTWPAATMELRSIYCYLQTSIESRAECERSDSTRSKWADGGSSECVSVCLCFSVGISKRTHMRARTHAHPN